MKNSILIFLALLSASSIIPAFGGSYIPDGAVTTAKIATSAVTTAKILDANITQGKLAPKPPVVATAPGGSVLVTASTSNFTTTSATYIAAAAGSLVTVAGRPVALLLIPDGSGNASYMGQFDTSSGCRFAIYRDTTLLAEFTSTVAVGAGGGVYPVSALSYLDTSEAGTPGTYGYSVRVKNLNASTCYLYYAKLIAYEI